MTKAKGDREVFPFVSDTTSDNAIAPTIHFRRRRGSPIVGGPTTSIQHQVPALVIFPFHRNNPYGHREQSQDSFFFSDVHFKQVIEPNTFRNTTPRPGLYLTSPQYNSAKCVSINDLRFFTNTLLFTNVLGAGNNHENPNVSRESRRGGRGAGEYMATGRNVTRPLNPSVNCGL